MWWVSRRIKESRLSIRVQAECLVHNTTSDQSRTEMRVCRFGYWARGSNEGSAFNMLSFRHLWQIYLEILVCRYLQEFSVQQSKNICLKMSVEFKMTTTNPTRQHGNWSWRRLTPKRDKPSTGLKYYREDCKDQIMLGREKTTNYRVLKENEVKGMRKTCAHYHVVRNATQV